MLALSRKPGQSLRIGRDILVHVVRVRFGQVRLAIQAPPHVCIVRTELLEERIHHGDTEGRGG